MAPKSRPPAFQYSSFDQINPGTEVHLRVKDADPDGDRPPHFENATLMGAVRTTGRVKTGKFYIPSLGYDIDVTDVQYAAWTRQPT